MAATIVAVSPERLRFVFIGLLSLVMAAGGLWMFLGATGWHDKTWGAVGVLFFGLGGAWMLSSSVTKDEGWLKRQAQASRAPSRHRHFIAPVVLLVTLPWSLKLWFCLPLLVGWGVLFPRYQDRRALHAACGLAAVIAIGQATLAVMATRDMDPADPWARAMQLLFMVVVLAVDARLLWEVRKRMWPPAAPQEISPR